MILLYSKETGELKYSFVSQDEFDLFLFMCDIDEIFSKYHVIEEEITCNRLSD